MIRYTICIAVRCRPISDLTGVRNSIEITVLARHQENIARVVYSILIAVLSADQAIDGCVFG